jgi:hypothetical protein
MKTYNPEHIEAATVCVGYGDFLEVAARHNRGLFDRWIIGTTEADKETHEVCRKWNLELFKTDECTRGGKFQKGRILNRLQRLLSVDSWRVFLDSDIILPTTFRHSVAAADLDSNKIYGCDRVMVKSWQEWQNLLNSGYLGHQHDYHCRVIFPKGVEVGSRWASPDHGYCPIGFFQMWHSDADEFVSFQNRDYPQRHGEASRTDTQHPLQWDRRKRELLAEVIVVHLESEQAAMGANWNGRKTKRFAAPPVEGHKKPEHHHHHGHHHHHHHHHPHPKPNPYGPCR